jgi:hypothetical protein
MKVLLIPLLLVSLFAVPRESVSIEVDESKDEFRVVVQSDRKIKFDALQTESPSPGFPAAHASVLVMNSRGEIVGCHSDNLPYHVANNISGSLKSGDRKIVRVTKDRPYTSPWYKSQSLFFGFDRCVFPERRGEYVRYQIQIEIETSKGVISTKTDWLPISGIEPKGRESVVEPMKGP